MKRTLVTALLIVMSFVVCIFAFSACSPNDSVLPELTGVYATDTTVVYDGKVHSITVNNTLATDTVLYSSDNSVWSDKAPSFTLPDTYTIYYSVHRDGFADFFSSATLTISRSILTSVSAQDKYVVYDGLPHTLDVLGLSSTDAVSFSLDGIEFSSSIECTEVGKYNIFYRVVGAYGDYADSATLYILPDISGAFLNSDNGVVILTNNTCILDNSEFPISYDVSGCGLINSSVPFSVDGNVLSVLDHEYSRIPSGDYIYCINGQYCHYSSDSLQISIYFSDNCALLKVSNVEILSIKDVNYCADGNYSDYDMSYCSVTVNASSFITSCTLSFFLLPVIPAASLHSLRFTYDGQAHTYSFLGYELYFFEDTPKYTDIGSYSNEAVILKNGYLPLKTTVYLDIAPDISGTYFNSNSLLVISSESVMLNGNTVDCEFTDGYWFIDGNILVISDNTISFNGNTLVKATNIILCFDFGTEIIYRQFNNQDNLMITVEVLDDGYSVFIPSFTDKVYLIDGLDKDLFINNVKWTRIDEPDDDASFYVVSMSDILGFKTSVVVFMWM